MALFSRIRAVSASRQFRQSAPPHRPSAAPRDTSHRHPAMSGLDISPVHGRHCICDRCTTRGNEPLRRAS